jgi:hypothetical protein
MMQHSFQLVLSKMKKKKTNTISKKLVLALQSNKGLALEKLGRKQKTHLLKQENLDISRYIWDWISLRIFNNSIK